MEVQNKEALNKSAEVALKLFEENLSGTSILKSSDAEPKVKQVVLAALKQFPPSQ